MGERDEPKVAPTEIIREVPESERRPSGYSGTQPLPPDSLPPAAAPLRPSAAPQPAPPHTAPPRTSAPPYPPSHRPPTPMPGQAAPPSPHPPTPPPHSSSHVRAGPKPTWREIVERLREVQGQPHPRLRSVARGGMGSIELVEDRALGRRQALKELHPQLLRDDEAVRMFAREAQITGQLEHPNIVPVYALGEERGRLYFTMKLVEGRSLRELIDQFPPGPNGRDALFDLLEVLLKVCDALAYAHSRGVIHCDLKPANVMVGDFGQVYLMDWGVARLLDEHVPTGWRGPVTDPFGAGTLAEGVIAGTPSHMSPEQAKGGRLDERSDVFSVGAMLYHVIARRPPYEGQQVTERLERARVGDYPPLRRAAPTVPQGLEAIVARAMALEPQFRYPRIADLRRDLVAFLRGDDAFPVKVFARGQHVVVEGHPGDAAYFIKSGRCEAHRLERGQRVSLRVMGPGETFGETAILSPGPRTATVTALDRLEVHVITAQVLQHELGATKPWLAAIVQTLARRFRERG